MTTSDTRNYLKDGAVVIRVASTYFEVRCNANGQIHPMFNIIRWVSSTLTESDYNQTLRRYQVTCRYTFFDSVNEIFRAPKYSFTDFVAVLNECHIPLVIEQVSSPTGRDIDISIRTGYELRPDQATAIEFIRNNPLSISTISLQTGAGKTFVVLAYICEVKKCTLILTDGLLVQWMDEFQSKTTCSRDDIYVIQGVNSIKMLMTSEDFYPKIIIASIPTMNAYAQGKENYIDLPPVQQLIEKFGVAVKAVDESHLRFHMNTITDLHLNVESNIYLSASPTRSDANSRRIFNTVYPKECRYERPYEKYVNIYAYGYRLGDMHTDWGKVSTHKGYNHAKYEGRLLNKQELFESFVIDTLKPAIDEHFVHQRDPGHKLLVIFNTVQAVEKTVYALTKLYPQYTICGFTQGCDISNLESDIIVSTPKSCGTGRDIPMLFATVLTSSIASEPLNKQILGRLRKLPDGKTPRFIKLFNANVPQQLKHQYYCDKLYQELGLNYTKYVTPTLGDRM